jgi:hypothetical protein
VTMPGRDGSAIFCVIGIPRSGTSLTTRILNLAGVYLGPESEMLAPGRLNPKGFWENRRLDRLNGRLLKALGSRILSPTMLPPDWAASEALEAERQEARALLAETFGGHRRWGFKITVATMVLPFWQQLLPEMRYVICLRNPLDVAASAGEIEALSTAQILDAWPRHVAAALAYTAGRPRIVVAYDDYLHARRETVERLWRFVWNEPGPQPDEAARLEASVDESLLHHRTPVDRTLHDDRLPPETKSMYLITELLRRAAPEPSEARNDTAALQGAVDAYARRLMSE